MAAETSEMSVSRLPRSLQFSFLSHKPHGPRVLQTEVPQFSLELLCDEERATTDDGSDLEAKDERACAFMARCRAVYSDWVPETRAHMRRILEEQARTGEWPNRVSRGLNLHRDRPLAAVRGGR